MVSGHLSHGLGQGDAGGLEDLAGGAGGLGAQEEAFAVLSDLHLFEAIEVAGHVGPLDVAMALASEPVLEFGA